MEARFKSLKKTETSLNMSLARSRASTPSTSPSSRASSRSPKTVTRSFKQGSPKEAARKVQKRTTDMKTHSSKGKGKTRTAERSEYNSFLHELTEAKN